MNRAPVWRALVALIVVGLTGFFALTNSPRLGLDLRGGTQIVLQTKDSPTTKATSAATDRTLEVLRRRVDALGVSEPTLARSGTNRIIVELPGVTDAASAEAAIGKTAQLTIHPVLGDATTAATPSTAPTASGAPLPVPSATVAPPASAPAAPSTSSSPAALGRPGETTPALVPAAYVQQASPSPSPSASASPAASATPSPAVTPGQDDGAVQQASSFDPTKASQTIADDNGGAITIGPAALTGNDVGDASVQSSQQTGALSVSVDFRGGGGGKWEKLTAQAACQPTGDPKRRIAIILDGKVISSPQVDPSVQCNVGIVGGSTQITGSFNQKQANDLAVLIKGGALPVPVETVSRSFVGPTLGKTAIHKSILAAIIGFIITALFFSVVYRIVGVLAVLALLSYGVIAYGTLVALGATLTLPGLAGLLLSAGLAIDANVLAFERAREEFAGQRAPRLIASLDNGYNRALSAIVDSNATTVLAAALLFLLATGPVRGFGVTLAIGTLSSMVSALLVSRVLTDFVVQRGLVRKRPRISGIGAIGRFRTMVEQRNPDIMTRYKLWFTITTVALVVALAGIFVRGFNFGIEFTGGRVVQYTPSHSVSVEDARAAVTSAGFPTAVVQETGDQGKPDISIRTGNVSDADEARIKTALTKVAGDVKLVSDDKVGPTLGTELRNKAILALFIALAVQLLYLAVRFRWTFAAAAVTAIFHDVLIVLGLFVWLGKPIDSLFLASALTIIGVSVNDTIITLDRVRETWGANRTKPLPGIINKAILSTSPRTINTTLGALFILGSLLFLGGTSLSDFALALVVGQVVGTYSSAFFVSPLIVQLEKLNSAPPPMPKRRVSSSSSARRRGPQPIFSTRGGGAVR